MVMFETIRGSHSGHQPDAAHRHQSAYSLPKLMVAIAGTIALDLLIIAGIYLVLSVHAPS